jgi:hypothetical protein
MAFMVHAEEFRGFAGLPADVCTLFDAAEQDDFQNGLDWYRLLACTTVTSGVEVSLLVSRRDGRATAALPVQRLERRFGSEVQALSNYYTSRFTPPVVPGTQVEDIAVLFAALRERQPHARSLILAPMAHGGPQFGLMRDALRLAGLTAFEYFCFGNWYLPLAPRAATSEQYFSERPSELRNTLRRMARRFDAEKGRIEIACTDADLDRAIAAYTSVYAASWKQPEPHPQFMPGLIRLCARRGWLRLGIAWLGERPIAAQLWVVAHGRASIYKLAYDKQFARLSPGSLLTAALMRHVIDEDGVKEVDYLTGDDAYKRDWMTHRRERWGLVAYDPRSPGGAWLLARELAARASRPLVGRWRSWRGGAEQAARRGPMLAALEWQQLEASDDH